MPRKLRKSLQIYLSKLKGPPHRTFTASTGQILAGCRYPKTPSFAFDRDPPADANAAAAAATLSDIDRFLSENFQSLYSDEEEEEKNAGKAPATPFGSVRTSRNNQVGPARFFVSTGSSGSLVQKEAWMSSATSTTTDAGWDSSYCSGSGSGSNIRVAADDPAPSLPDDCIAVLAYSPDPCEDFRRSMERMIGARFGGGGEKVDWDYMEELLFCYLNLNERRSYKYILSAFVDLVVVLRQNSSGVPEAAATCRKVQTSGERKKKKKKKKERGYV